MGGFTTRTSCAGTVSIACLVAVLKAASSTCRGVDEPAAILAGRVPAVADASVLLPSASIVASSARYLTRKCSKIISGSNAWP